MAPRLTAGPTGYCIHSDRGLPFDLADLEAWEYVNCTEKVARELAKGFPEYWIDFLGESQPSVHIHAEQLAAAHRRRVIPLLAADSPQIPLPPYPNPSAPESSYQQSKVLRKHYDELRWPTCKVVETSGIPPHGNVLIRPFFTYRLDYGDHAFSLQPWLEMARKLFDQLRNEKLYHLNPSALNGRFKKRQRLADGSIHVRGPRLADQSLLETLFPQSAHNPVRWGPLCYDTPTIFNSHFCIAGKPRSGKTTLLRLLFQSLFTTLNDEARFVIYDAKPDLLPCLFPPSSAYFFWKDDDFTSKFYLLNPFDRRCTPWDIATDADSSLRARAIAEILFPKTSESQKFFDNAPRDVATAVMNNLRRRADKSWTFYDFLMALQPENIEAVLCDTVPGSQVYKTYFSGPRSSPGDLLGTITSQLGQLIPIACSWQHSERDPLSFKQWVKVNPITIVLANHAAYFTAIQELNRILLNVLTRELLACEELPARTFIYLDEFEHLGYIPTLGQLMETGASRGVNLALCFHDVGMLADVYRQSTEGLVGQSTFYAYLAVTNQRTATWASGMIGPQEVLVEQRSSRADSHEQDSAAHDTVSFHPMTRDLVMPAQLMHLPPTNRTNGLTAYFAAPHHGPYKGSLTAEKTLPLTDASSDYDDDSCRLWPEASRVAKFDPQLPEYLEPPDDTFATLYELGFRKPGYSPETSQPSPAAEVQPEQTAATTPLPITPMPSPPETLPPEETRSPEASEAAEPTSGPDYLDNLDFGDE